jgi:hypothetical protein
MVKSLFWWTTMSMSHQRTKKIITGNLGRNGEEPLLVDDHVHVAAEGKIKIFLRKPLLEW